MSPISGHQESVNRYQSEYYAPRLPVSGERSPPQGVFRGVRHPEYWNKKKTPIDFRQPESRRTAATYSPTWWGSTIGASELNFSVRNGKRWVLTAITTAIYYLRDRIFGFILSVAPQLRTTQSIALFHSSSRLLVCSRVSSLKKKISGY